HLQELIRTKYGASRVLVSGGIVSVCVEGTLRGATRNGFDAWAIYDRMFSSRSTAENEQFLHQRWAMNTNILVPAGTSPAREVVSAQDVFSRIRQQYIPA
ncbi:MAG TPA: hypothetical protein VFR09_03785, partial [Alphaproteobacteria bacterium]|nr:hypothetical protein [Alphaproteobacteria bacterium]